jgi:hypothetical protein
MVKRVMVSMDKLSTTGTYEPTENEPGYPQIGTPKGPSPVVLMAAGAVLGSAATLLIKVLTK